MNAAPHQTPNPRRLYRDTEHGVISGVCAGIADYFGFSVRGLRGLMILSCLFAFPAVVFSYIAATVLLQKKPVNLYHEPADEEFWQSVRRDPHFTCDDIRASFRDLDRRLQSMEQYVTSPRFDLDQQFKEL
jgi:phage shock protein C